MGKVKRCVGCGAVLWILVRGESGEWQHADAKVCPMCAEKVVDDEEG